MTSRVSLPINGMRAVTTSLGDGCGMATEVGYRVVLLVVFVQHTVYKYRDVDSISVTETNRYSYRNGINTLLTKSTEKLPLCRERLHYFINKRLLGV